jgi:viologen exporter family transport system permease protein
MLFFRYVVASLRSQAQYPGSAALLTLGNFLATGVEVVALLALFGRFGDVRGWRFGEVALLYALVNIEFAVAELLSRGFDVLGTELIRTGSFDRLLLRPRSLVLQLVAYDVRISRLGRLAQAGVVLALATESAPIRWTLGHVALFAWAVAGGAALFMALLVLQGTLAIFTVESLEVVNVLTYGGVQAAQYPLTIYGRGLRRFLTVVVPLGAVTYLPALHILGKADPLGAPAWLGLLSPGCGFVFLALALGVWRWGVGRYVSTGS